MNSGDRRTIRWRQQRPAVAVLTVPCFTTSLFQAERRSRALCLTWVVGIILGHERSDYRSYCFGGHCAVGHCSSLAWQEDALVGEAAVDYLFVRPVFRPFVLWLCRH
jgi:hypothetical protein